MLNATAEFINSFKDIQSKQDVLISIVRTSDTLQFRGNVLSSFTYTNECDLISSLSPFSSCEFSYFIEEDDNSYNPFIPNGGNYIPKGSKCYIYVYSDTNACLLAVMYVNDFSRNGQLVTVKMIGQAEILSKTYLSTIEKTYSNFDNPAFNLSSYATKIFGDKVEFNGVLDNVKGFAPFNAESKLDILVELCKYTNSYFYEDSYGIIQVKNSYNKNNCDSVTSDNGVCYVVGDISKEFSKKLAKRITVDRLLSSSSRFDDSLNNSTYISSIDGKITEINSTDTLYTDDKIKEMSNIANKDDFVIFKLNFEKLANTNSKNSFFYSENSQDVIATSSEFINAIKQTLYNIPDLRNHFDYSCELTPTGFITKITHTDNYAGLLKIDGEWVNFEEFVFYVAVAPMILTKTLYDLLGCKFSYIEASNNKISLTKDNEFNTVLDDDMYNDELLCAISDYDVISYISSLTYRDKLSEIYTTIPQTKTLVYTIGDYVKYTDYGIGNSNEEFLGTICKVQIDFNGGFVCTYTISQPKEYSISEYTDFRIFPSAYLYPSDYKYPKE